MTLPTPHPPPPEPLGGNPDLDSKPGEDPWWWTRFVGEEKWRNQVWFRALLVIAILGALVIILEAAS